MHRTDCHVTIPQIWNSYPTGTGANRWVLANPINEQRL